MNQPNRFPVQVVALGSILLLNGVLGTRWLFDGADHFSETAASWEFATFQRVYLIALVLLAVLVPGLRELRGRAGTRISPTVLTALTGAVVLQAGTVFTMAFVAPFYADTAPATLDMEDGGSFALAMTVVWVLFAGTVIALGVSVLRTRTLPVSTGVLMILAALLTPILGPVGSIVLGAAFVRAGLALRLRVASPDPAPAAAAVSG